MLLAFGSLVAAGLPLMLTILGLVAAAGMLFLGAQLFDISIWAMNFALMFALALGIDYALFIVARFRQALDDEGRSPVDAVAAAMDTAGKAVAFSGLTVLISLSAVMLVPSPAFRSMALGIMLAVAFVLAASLTLLPAVLAKLGPRIDRLAPPFGGSREHRSPRLAAWAARAWRRPLVVGLARRGGGRRAGLAGRPARHRHAVDHRRAGRGRLARRATTACSTRSAKAPPARCRSSRPRSRPTRSRACVADDPGIVSALPAQTAGGIDARPGDPGRRPVGGRCPHDDRPPTRRAARRTR